MNQNATPLVTAVIPVYNHEQFVGDSIRSIINQSYQRIELIVINDGSQDRSHDVVLSFAEECKQRFERFEFASRSNKGLSATLNQALDMASGKYFSPMASDDVALPGKFEHLVRALELSDKNVAAAFGDATFIDERGKPSYLNAEGVLLKSRADRSYGSFLSFSIRNRLCDWKVGPFGSYKGLLFANYLPAMSSMLVTDCVRESGGWTVGNVLEDWEMWLKLSKRYNFLFVDEAECCYRVHGQNSYDTLRTEILRAAVALIANERKYCADNGLAREWKDSFNHQLFRLLMDGNLPLRTKIRELKSAEFLPFVRFLVKARRNTIMRSLLGKAASLN